MLWVWAPPSDHVLNWYATSPGVWGEGALMELAEPRITVRVNGVTEPVAPTTS
jgi:hypothetical protein